MNHILVFDVGKTHVKLHLLDEELKTVNSRMMKNIIIDGELYPHCDIDGIWLWLLSGISEFAAAFHISAISITTHGATAALIDREKSGSALVLPVLDYEYAGVEGLNEAYKKVRPDFSGTFSPDLPFGLNLGRQLFWQKENFQAEFSQVTDILMYPQYWAWRLSGKRCSEVTSLGCHTDLWCPDKRAYSSLVEEVIGASLFPSVVPAWTNLGPVTKDLQSKTGVSENCQVFAGVHDSNASFLRYKKYFNEIPFTVISTGTWAITMASGVSTENLKPDCDMLANVDVTGQPTVCARFMGGREFDTLCKLTKAGPDDKVNGATLQKLIENEIMALPDFSGGSGPFPQARGGISGAVSELEGTALASIYCALMLDHQLSMVGAVGNIYIEGAFAQNVWLCAILAQLRIDQAVFASDDTTGTVQGCAQLVSWGDSASSCFSMEKVKKCKPAKLYNLEKYKADWLNRIGNNGW